MALFAAVALLAFAAYFLLSPPVSGSGDSSELTLVLATNGVAHPTGYPLYVLLGHLFARALHALGATWPKAAAAWSAGGAAAAIFFLQLLAWELAGARAQSDARVRAAATIAATAFFALDPIWLAQATLAEVYTWHVAWTCAFAWSFLRAFRSPGAIDAAIYGLLLGVGLAHHRTSVVWIVALSAVLLIRAARLLGWSRAFGLAALALAAALPPLAGYTIVAWRAFHPTVIQWPALAPSWPSIFDHITGREYADYLGHFAPDPGSKALLARAAYPLLGAGFLAMLWSAIRARRDVATWALTGSTALATAVVFTYGIPDPEPLFLAPMAIAGAALAPALLALHSPKLPRLERVGVAAVILVALAVWGFSGVRDQLEQRSLLLHNEDVLRRMWAALPDDSTMVFWPSDAYLRLREYQIFQNEKPKLYAMNPSFLGYAAVRAQFEQRFGFDPMEGFEFEPIAPGTREEARSIREMLARLVFHVNRRTLQPVLYMDPEGGVLLRLSKADSSEQGQPHH